MTASDTPVSGLDPETARAVLRWYVEAGVDIAVEDTPQDRFAEARPAATASAPAAAPEAAASPAPRPSTRPQAPPPVAPSAAQALEDAVHRAQAAATLDDLKDAVAAFDGCPLKATATNLVFGDGEAGARVMFIGEAPGAEEDRRGVPFVGVSGQLLDTMLASIGLARADVFIANTLFWRPPGNRTPTPAETQVCRPFVERMVELVDPQIMVLLGRAAAQSMLGRTEAMGRLRGSWMEYGSKGLSRPIPALAMYHPAYLLRTPSAKRHAWRDLLMIKEKLSHGASG
jgi:uracil-DNA glycosylase family 4